MTSSDTSADALYQCRATAGREAAQAIASVSRGGGTEVEGGRFEVEVEVKGIRWKWRWQVVDWRWEVVDRM